MATAAATATATGTGSAAAARGAGGAGREQERSNSASPRQSQRERATLPLCWDDKRNEWRKRYLYNKGCDDMVRAHLARLEKLYKKNISRDRAKSRLWTLDVWIKVLEQIDFFDQTFTYQQACYCFCMAKMTVVDEVYSRDKHCNLTYVDFLEAICRLAEFKTLPNEEELEEYHVTNVVDLIDALQESECTWGQWLLARPSPESRDLGPLDHRVVNKTCVECGEGLTNLAGDDESGDDTECRGYGSGAGDVYGEWSLFTALAVAFAAAILC